LEEGFDGLIPIWNIAPWMMYFFLLGLDYGAIRAIRDLVEGEQYTTRFSSFRLGDVLGLPMYGAFAAVVVSKASHPNAFYNESWLQWLLLGVGIAVSLLMQLRSWLTGFYLKEGIFNPSELYHTAVYGVMFYFVASSVAPMWHNHEPLWAAVLATGGLALWFICVVVDSLDPTPVRGRKAFWEIWQRN
jgi:hypothetical protein